LAQSEMLGRKRAHPDRHRTRQAERPAHALLARQSDEGLIFASGAFFALKDAHWFLERTLQNSGLLCQLSVTCR
jgi:hypothetical protein